MEQFILSIPLLHFAAERTFPDAIFTHGKDFLQAITLGKSDFEVYENRTRTADLINLNDYAEMAKTFLYDTRSSYSLKSDPSNYINFDDIKHMASFGSIHELTDSHIVQCGHKKDIPIGSFLVGSSRGTWSREFGIDQELKRSLAHLSQSHLEVRKDKGLLIIRKVVRTENYRTNELNYFESCSKLHTENIHPLELFSKMELQTITESPFEITYNQRKETDSKSQSSPSSSHHLRKELSQILKPDLPITHCDGDTSGESYSYKYGLIGCAEYSADASAFNFNYDTTTGKHNMLR